MYQPRRYPMSRRRFLVLDCHGSVCWHGKLQCSAAVSMIDLVVGLWASRVIARNNVDEAIRHMQGLGRILLSSTASTYHWTQQSSNRLHSNNLTVQASR